VDQRTQAVSTTTFEQKKSSSCCLPSSVYDAGREPLIAAQKKVVRVPKWPFLTLPKLESIIRFASFIQSSFLKYQEASFTKKG